MWRRLILLPICFLCLILLDTRCSGKIETYSAKPDARRKKDTSIIFETDSSIIYGNDASLYPSVTDSGSDLFQLGDLPLSETGLPIHPGDPCHDVCGSDNLICHGGFCLTKCQMPSPACNQHVDPCGPNEACWDATSFTDACYPATVNLGDLCEDAVCPPGTMCIGHNGPPLKCYKICLNNSGCQTGYSCKGITISSGCPYCIPN
jgi:hypothetical protein